MKTKQLRINKQQIIREVLQMLQGYQVSPIKATTKTRDLELQVRSLNLCRLP